MKSSKRNIGLILLLLIIIWLLGGIFADNDEIEESETSEIVDHKVDTLDFSLHYRLWNSDQHKFNLFYKTYVDTASIATHKRTLIVPSNVVDSYAEYWGHIYRQLIPSSATSVDFLVDSILSLYEAKEKDDVNRAMSIVSFVQDIPYTLISSTPCDGSYEPCQGEIKYGILSPYEFIHTELGDCDTRSVLLYKLLISAGFGTLVIISKEYRHAMIAVDIPASGEYLLYRGRKHFVWETTATGWPPGVLPPENKNLNYWNIALAYE